MNSPRPGGPLRGGTRALTRVASALVVLLLLSSPAAAGEAADLMLDAFAPFYNPDKPPPNSWAMPYSHIDRAEAPYVDQAHLDASVERFRSYARLARKRGYTALLVGNLIHLANFDLLPKSEPPVYAPDSPWRKRHEAWQAAFREMVKAARAEGLDVVVETDFPSWTPPLQRWLGPGGQSVDNPRLWIAWEAALKEVLGELGADALSVRVGEGGGAYNEADTGYSSTVLVLTVEQTRKTVRELMAIIDRINAAAPRPGRAGAPRDKRLFFRTWTIGLGEIGALHTNPELYHRVFSEFYGRPNLVTLIKHVAMDFFEFIPPNPTIGIGGLPQIVEVQARREYEAFNLYPNYRAEPFQQTARRLRASRQVRGISVWPTNGGFLMKGRVLYGCNGPDYWIDSNVHAYSALFRKPEQDLRKLAEAWAMDRGLSQTDARRLAPILLISDDIIRKGLYITPFAEEPKALLGLDVLPSQLWHYWTRPVGARIVQSFVYRHARHDLPRAVREGREVLTMLGHSRTAAKALSDSPLKAHLLSSLEYERSHLEVLARYRETFLPALSWSETGRPADFEAWQSHLGPLEQACDDHERAWQDSLFLPAMDLQELRRVIADGRTIPSLLAPAGLLAVLQLALALLLLQFLRAEPSELTRRISEKPGVLPGLAGAACVLAGLTPLFLSAMHGGVRVFLGGAIPAAVFLAITRVSLGPARKPDRHDPADLRAALPAMAAPLLLAALPMFVFAMRGPAPLFLALVAAIEEPAAARLVLLPPIAALVLWLSVLAHGGACRSSIRGAVLAPLTALLLTAVIGWGTVVTAGPSLAVGISRELRLLPTILGEAGTGVEELVSGQDG